MDFEAKVWELIQTTTRPVLPQLVTLYKDDDDDNEGEQERILFTMSLLVLTCPDMSPGQPAAVQAQGPRYLGNYLLAKGFPLPTEVEHFIKRFASYLTEKSGDEEEELILALTTGLWEVLGKELLSANGKTGLVGWLLNACPGLVKRLTYFPLEGVFTQGMSSSEFIKMLPTERHPPPGSTVPVGALMIPKSTLDGTLSNARSTNNAVVTEAHRLVNSFVRINRALCVQWFHAYLGMNWSRGKLQAEVGVQGDLYAWNVEGCWLLLCSPFWYDVERPLLSFDYSSHSSEKLSALIRDATKVVQAEDTENHKGEINFVTHCFWMTVLAMNLGTGSMVRACTALLKELGEMIRSMDSVPPPMRPRMHQQICSLVDEKLGFDLYLLDPTRINHIQAFLHFALQKILRASDFEYAQLPEFLFDLVFDIFLHYAHCKVPFEHVDAQSDFILLMLQEKRARNPYLRAKAVELLMLLEDVTRFKPTLASSLILFYAQVEMTGSATGFYDKYSIRYQLATLLMTLWDSSQHAQALKVLAERSTDVLSPFVRFVNYLLNDVTYLLDESFSKLQELHKNDNSEGTSSGQEEQRQRMMVERQCTSCTQLANVSMELLERFTRSTPVPFARPEIVSRLAAMLNLVYDPRFIFS